MDLQPGARRSSAVGTEEEANAAIAALAAQELGPDPEPKGSFIRPPKKEAAKVDDQTPACQANLDDQ